jgi:hypothetical protein
MSEAQEKSGLVHSAVAEVTAESLAEKQDIVLRLRDTPNWMRESFGHWKSCTKEYDRAPFDAADEIERLRTLLPAWQPIETAPIDRHILAVVDGSVRVIRYGKASHIPWRGFCLADQGAEDFDLCEPTHWMPLPHIPE